MQNEFLKLFLNVSQRNGDYLRGAIIWKNCYKKYSSELTRECNAVGIKIP